VVSDTLSKVAVAKKPWCDLLLPVLVHVRRHAHRLTVPKATQFTPSAIRQAEHVPTSTPVHPCGTSASHRLVGTDPSQCSSAPSAKIEAQISEYVHMARSRGKRLPIMIHACVR